MELIEKKMHDKLRDDIKALRHFLASTYVEAQNKFQMRAVLKSLEYANIINDDDVYSAMSEKQRYIFFDESGKMYHTPHKDGIAQRRLRYDEYVLSLKSKLKFIHKNIKVCKGLWILYETANEQDYNYYCSKWFETVRGVMERLNIIRSVKFCPDTNDGKTIIKHIVSKDELNYARLERLSRGIISSDGKSSISSIVNCLYRIARKNTSSNVSLFKTFNIDLPQFGSYHNLNFVVGNQQKKYHIEFYDTKNDCRRTLPINRYFTEFYSKCLKEYDKDDIIKKNVVRVVEMIKEKLKVVVEPPNKKHLKVDKDWFWLFNQNNHAHYIDTCMNEDKRKDYNQPKFFNGCPTAYAVSLIDDNGEVLALSTLWTDVKDYEGNVINYLDGIYTTKGGDEYKYALLSGMIHHYGVSIHKKVNASCTDQYDTAYADGRDYKEYLEVRCTNEVGDYFFYMDTFKTLDIYDRLIKTSGGEEPLDMTDCSIIGGELRCSCCDCQLDEDEMSWVGGDPYCYDCSIYDDLNDETIRNDDAVCYNYDYYTHTSSIGDSIFEVNGEYFTEDRVVYVECCCEYRLIEDAMFDDISEVDICNDCAIDYYDADGNQRTTTEDHIGEGLSVMQHKDGEYYHKDHEIWSNTCEECENEVGECTCEKNDDDDIELPF